MFNCIDFFAMSAPAPVTSASPTVPDLEGFDADGLRAFINAPPGWDVVQLGSLKKPCVAGGTSHTSVAKLLKQAKEIHAKVLALPPAPASGATIILPFPTEEEIGGLAKDDVASFSSILKYLQAGATSAPALPWVQKYPQAAVTSEALSALAARLAFFDSRGLPDFCSDDNDVLRD